MRVGVTGATGFIGQAVITELTGRGHDAVALVRSPSGYGGERVIGDLSASGLFPANFSDLDAIVHAAARCHVMRDPDPDPAEAFRRVNVAGTARLARAAATAGVRRLVFISSIKVNGEATADGQPFRFDDIPAPSGAYANSKLEAEQALASIGHETGMEIVVLRPALVYGKGVKANFAALIKAVRAGLPLPFAGVRNRRSIVFVTNLANLVATAVEHPAAAGRILLAADPDPLSTPDLIKSIAQAMGRPARIFPVPLGLLAGLASLVGRRAVVHRLFGSLEVDIEETQRVLGWRSPVALVPALQETVEQEGS